ncbi:MAG: regulatory protein RecX [Cyclobacteriaceae bacterium]
MSDDRLKRGFASAAKYCAFRERAPKQVREKLLSWDFKEEEVEEIIHRLLDEKFLDEARFARAFCHDKFEFNHWGKVKIKMEMGRYDLSYQVMEEALNAINQEKYLDVIHTLTHKKWETVKDKGEEYLQKRKVADYMMRKGFEGDHVWKVIKQL